MISQTSRQQQLHQFVKQALTTPHFSIEPLAGDASFRRYFRLTHQLKTLVVMDAPPEHEDCRPFMQLDQLFLKHQLRVPAILASDLEQGFLLLEDLGDDLFFRVLNTDNADFWYGQAIKELNKIQSCNQNSYAFPSFATMMAEELARFREWYLLKHLNLNLTTKEETLLADTFNLLIASALEQPQVCVHRDYHSRNLLALPNGGVGVLDFQDAVWGPISYDLVSLIRDCYVAWPQEKVEQWSYLFFEQALANTSLTAKQRQYWPRWFDWMGIQRHLKAIYIFARKWHRDDNPNYLADIPRTLDYVTTVAAHYPELKNFHHFMQEKINKIN